MGSAVILYLMSYGTEIPLNLLCPSNPTFFLSLFAFLILSFAVTFSLTLYCVFKNGCLTLQMLSCIGNEVKKWHQNWARPGLQGFLFVFSWVLVLFVCFSRCMFGLVLWCVWVFLVCVFFKLHYLSF